MEATKTSPKRSRQIQVQLADGNIEDAEFVYYAEYGSESNPGKCCVELTINNVGSYYKESHNYFDALMDVRTELEPLGIKLLCYGARRDVWASGMQRDMAAGSVAYLLSAYGEGRKPEQSIFDCAPAECVGTVLEQREYFDEWRARKAG